MYKHGDIWNRNSNGSHFIIMNDVAYNLTVSNSTNTGFVVAAPTTSFPPATLLRNSKYVSNLSELMLTVEEKL
jgi:hypothetical protein